MNFNVNNKLQLAKDELKRLQEEIRELLNKNSHLQNDIDDLCKQKEDALTKYMYNDFFTYITGINYTVGYFHSTFFTYSLIFNSLIHLFTQ